MRIYLPEIVITPRPSGRHKDLSTRNSRNSDYTEAARPRCNHYFG